MLGFLIFLLVVWVVLIIVGATIKGLFWLVVIGIVLFLVTAAWGFFKREVFSRKK